MTCLDPLPYLRSAAADPDPPPAEGRNTEWNWPRPARRRIAHRVTAETCWRTHSSPKASIMCSRFPARASSTRSTGCTTNGGKIKLVTCRFEAGAVNMADAYGKLTGRPAAAMVTRGPGACHGAIGVHVAYQDSTPMLLFVGQIPHEDTGRDAFQEVDYRQMFAPLAKWVTQIDYAKRIPEVVAHAVDVATSGRPGPVVIALSEEMQKDQVQVPDLPRAKVSPAFPDPEALLQMRDLAGEGEKADRHCRRILLDGGRTRGAARVPAGRTICRSPSASAGRRITTAARTISPATWESDRIPA